VAAGIAAATLRTARGGAVTEFLSSDSDETSRDSLSLDVDNGGGGGGSSGGGGGGGGGSGEMVGIGLSASNWHYDNVSKTKAVRLALALKSPPRELFPRQPTSPPKRKGGIKSSGNTSGCKISVKKLAKSGSASGRGRDRSVTAAVRIRSTGRPPKPRACK
jgi:hypothetical protein